MARVDPEIKRKQTFKMYDKNPILWIVVEGTIKDQKDMLIYEVLPEFIVSRKLTEAQFLWIPGHHDNSLTSFREDVFEILDGVNKIRKINVYHNTMFRLGLTTLRFGLGEKNCEANVKIERLNIAIKVAVHYLVRCRIVKLAKYTLAHDSDKKGKPRPRSSLNLQTREYKSLDSTQYK